MDDADDALACILAHCKSADDLNHYIMKYAIIVHYLVCCMAKEVHQTEDGIRTLYSTWADMAVEQLKDPRSFPSKKPH
jgi:hypothetical protein